MANNMLLNWVAGLVIVDLLLIYIESTIVSIPRFTGANKFPLQVCVGDHLAVWGIWMEDENKRVSHF